MSRHLKRLEKQKTVADHLSAALKGKDRDAVVSGLPGFDSNSDSDVVKPHENFAVKKKKSKRGKSTAKQYALAEDEEEPQQMQQHEFVATKKKKKKKKVQKQQVVQPPSSDSTDDDGNIDEDDDDADLAKLFEATSKKDILPAEAAPCSEGTLSKLFMLTASNLDASNEMKRMFGNIPLEGDRRHAPLANKKSLLITPEPTWPPVSCNGFDLSRHGSVYSIIESGEYLMTTKSVKAAIASDDANRVANIARKHPWHLRAAYQYGVILALTDRKDEAAEVFKRAAHAIAVVLRGSFSLLDTPNSRVLPFFNEGSDVIYLILQQLMHIHIRAGCLCTAFEVCKLVYNLSDEDPTGMVYNLEYLALRSGNHKWLLSVITQWIEEGMPEALLPVCTYGKALVLLRSGDEAAALEALQKGVVDWPELPSMLDANIPFVKHAADGTASNQVVRCYVARMRDMWNEGKPLQLLQRATEGLEDRLAHVEERVVERDFLLGSYGLGVRPNAVIGVVDEVMAGRDRDRDMLQRHWSRQLNALPTDVRERLLDYIADSDFSLLAKSHPVLLFFRTLLPWNTLAHMLSKVLMTKWRADNPSQAAEWDLEMELQRRLQMH